MLGVEQTLALGALNCDVGIVSTIESPSKRLPHPLTAFARRRFHDQSPVRSWSQALGRERRGFAGEGTIPILAGDLVGGA